jgi:class 3 adenylate cyclase
MEPSSLTGEALERAVAEEQERSSLQIGLLRLIGLTAFLTLVVLLRTLIPGWIGGVVRLGWYWVAAVLVYLGARRSRWIARLGGLAIPLVDMPMLFFVLSGVLTDLQTKGLATDARVVAAMAGLFYSLLVLLASFSLRDREIYLSAAVAALCEGPLLYRAGGDLTVVPAIELGLVMAGMLAVQASRRAIRLVQAVAAEQLFLSPEVARVVHERGLATVMRQDRVSLSVVVCDLRGFTAFSEAAAAEEVMQLLTEYYDAVGRVVTGFGGTIKDHAGDGVLSLVGAPVAYDDHAQRAVALAHELRARGAEVLAPWRRVGVELGLGIGVASGYVTVGAIRGATRLEYVAVGAAVTLASRLCQQAEPGQVLVDQRTVALVGDHASGYRLAELRTAELKGFARPVTIFELVA